MFKFSPFNWASSFVLSKFLAPYFKKIDDQQVDVGFWEGSLVLRDLEFKEDLLLQQNIDIQIVKSQVAEIKITIPWKQIKQKPIIVQLTGVKLVLSNFTNVSKSKRQQLQDQLQSLKVDSLQKFDEAVTKEKKTTEGGGFLMDFLKQLTDNFILEIKDLEIIYVYHINNFEIVKFGFNLDQISVQPGNIKDPNLNQLSKSIIVHNLSLKFEFYDNFSIIQQLYKFDDLQDENFIKTSTKADEFLSNLRRQNKEFMPELLNKEHSNDKQNDQQRFYILKKLDIFILIKVKLIEEMEIEVDVRTGSILIFLKQRQIRLLMRAIQDLLNHRTDRPKARPSQGQSAKQWWKYAIKRTIVEEHIVTKVKKFQIASYMGAERYRFLYSRKILKSVTGKRGDQDIMDTFERNNSLTQIIMLRSLAIDKIIQMRDLLRSSNISNQHQAQMWFTGFDSDFNLKHAAQMKFNSNLIKKQLYGTKLQDGADDLQPQNSVSMVVVFTQVIVMVQENESLQQLKSLHQQVNIFKKELHNKHQLRDQVLDHIRMNFLNKMSHVNKLHKTSIGDEWTVEQFLSGKQRLLVQLELNQIKFEYIRHGDSQQLIKGSVKHIALTDMNKVNVYYKRIFEIPEGLRFLHSSQLMKQNKKILEAEAQVVQVHLDVQLGPILVTACKPLFERMKSLISLVTFDPNEFTTTSSPQQQQPSQKQDQYFNQFLMQNKRVQTETNLSLRIQSFSLYIPLMYHRKSDMCLIHVKVLRFFKREHENNMVNVQNLNFEDMQIIKEHAKGNVDRYVHGLTQNKKIEKMTSQAQPVPGDTYYNLQPLFITLECMRTAFVRSYDWERKENLFLIEYDKLRGANTDDAINNDVESMFETLPIHLRMEQIVTRLQLGIGGEKKNRTYIFPRTKNVSLELPFLDIHLSIKHLYLIQQLLEIWSTKGYDFFDILGQAEPKTAPIDEIPSPSHHHNVISHQLEMQPKIVDFLKAHVMNKLEVRLDGLQFSLIVNTPQKLRMWNQYADGYLQGKVPVQQAQPVGQLINDADIVEEDNFVRANMFHENTILQIYLNKMLYSREDRYFESVQNMAIQEFLVRNISCHDFNIRAPLKMMCSNMLSLNDYSETQWKQKLKQTTETKQNNSSLKPSTLSKTFQIKTVFMGDNDDDALGDQLLQAMNDISGISPIPVHQSSPNPAPMKSPAIAESPSQKAINLLEQDSIIQEKPETVLQDIFAHEPFVRDFWMCKASDDAAKFCPRCHGINQPNQRLILSFQKQNESPDFYVFQITRHNVPQKGQPKISSPENELNLEVSALNFIMDPNMVRQIKMIIDIGAQTALLQREQFELWMKTSGFWPDFHEKWGGQVNLDPKVAISDLSEVTSKIQVNISAATILCTHQNILTHQNETIYLFNVRAIELMVSSSNLTNVTNFSAQGLSLFDTSRNSGNHPQLITNLSPERENSLTCEVRISKDENMVRIQKYRTYCGVRLRDCLVVFLKRNTNEIQYYIRQIAIASFYSIVSVADVDFIRTMQEVYLLKQFPILKQLQFYDQERLKKESADKAYLLKLAREKQEDTTPSMFRFSLVALESQVVAYRNSISEDAMYASFSKTGFWFTGQWGADFDSLIKTGLFVEELEGIQLQQYQMNTTTPLPSRNKHGSIISDVSPANRFNFVQPDIPEEMVFYEGLNDAQKLKEHLAGNLNESDHFYSAEGDTTTILESSQMVMMWDLEIRCCPGNAPETIFLKCPKNKPSLDIQILFDDKNFQQEMPGNAKNPMKIIVNLREAKLYAYDLDYCTLVKFFQENLGEQPQTVINPGVWDCLNTNIWMFLEVKLGRALAKFFKGKREDIDQMHDIAHTVNKKQRRRMFLYKNQASVALCKLKNVNFKFFLREGGGKLMKLLVETVNMADLRLDSLLHLNKWVLFREQRDQFRGEEDNQSDADYDEDSEDKNWTELDSEEEEDLKSKPVIAKKTVSFKPQLRRESFLALNEMNSEPSHQILLGASTTNPVKLNFPSPDTKPQLPTKKQSSGWSRFKALCGRMFCCRRKNQSLRQENLDNESDDGDLNQAQFIEQAASPDGDGHSILMFPKEEYPYRRWINYRIKHTLPVTMKMEAELNDLEEMVAENGFHSDFKLIFYSKPDGEKLIKMIVEDKNLLVIVDFLVEVVSYFRTPFNGSDAQPYQFMPLYNNYPPMVIDIKVKNVWALIPGDLVDKAGDSLAILIDVDYQQEWAGDNWIGPGSCEKRLDLKLKKTFIFRWDSIMLQSRKQESNGSVVDTSPQIQKGVKFRTGNQQSNSFRSLLEPFRLSLTTKYSVDFWRKVVDPSFGRPTIFVNPNSEAYPYYADLLQTQNKMEDFKSENQLVLRLINNKKLKNNFSISIRDIAQVSKILGTIGSSSLKTTEAPYTMTRKSQPEQTFVDYCCDEKRISIRSLRLLIQKNKEGVKVAIVQLEHLKIQNVTFDSRYKMSLVARISMDYFNKRKLDFEPVIEPWQFKLTVDNKQEQGQQQIQRDVQKIKLSNYIQKAVMSEEVPHYLKDHTNSLNFNISTGLIETGMEAFKIFEQKIDDGEPYRIFNRCGYPLELRDVKKDSSLSRINENGDMEWKAWRDLYFQDGVQRSQREGGQQMLLNMLVLKRETVNDEMLQEEDQVDEDSMNPGHISVDMGPQSSNKVGGMSPEAPKNRIMHSQLFHMSQSGQLPPKKKYTNLKKYSRNEISNYKIIKYVSLDYVGKRFYPLEKLHRIEQTEQAQLIKGNALDVFKSNIDKITGAFLTNSRKINEGGGVQLLVNVNINPQNGSKEITVSSSVKLYNFLDVPIEVGFLANGQSKESARVTIASKQIYPIPLEFLENKTEVRFVPAIIRKQNKALFSVFDYRYYQMEHLICDAAHLSEFEIDSDVIDVLEQADTYGNDHKVTSVIKNEFKDIKDPLVLKIDHQIYTTKNLAKSSNFYFIMSCVKVKHQTTTQKKAYISYMGNQRHTENENDDATACYETYLIFYPVFKIVNATIRRMYLFYGISSSSEKQREKQMALQSTRQDGHEYLDKQTVLPGDSFLCYKLKYSEDILLSISFDNYEESKEMKIFQRWFQFGEKKPKFEIGFQRKGSTSSQLYLFAKMNTLSQKTREIVIYCPYLIMNETDKCLMYREHGYAQDIVSVDQIQADRSHQKIYKSRVKAVDDAAPVDGFNNNKNEVEKTRIEEDLKSLHMFSTSTNMKKIQIALQDMNERGPPITNWSKPVSLKNNDGVHAVVGSTEVFKKNVLETRQYQIQSKENTRMQRDALSSKGKFEFGMKIINAPGVFHRSKLIIFAPRYIVHNEGKYPIVMAQADTEFLEDNLLRVKPNDWKYFYWSDVKKRDHVTISYYEQSTGQATGWSGLFLINKVCEIALKLKNPGTSLNYSLQKINISLIDDSVLMVRFVHEDPIIPPYYIENLTKYEIQFRQNNGQQFVRRFVQQGDSEPPQEANNGIQSMRPSSRGDSTNTTLSIAAGGNDYTILQPGERVAFTWDNWIDDNDHSLKVEIEGIPNLYHIDKIQDFQPIVLPSSLRRKTNKNFLYRQGELGLKEDNTFAEKYCVLNVLRQRLKIYNLDKTNRQVYSLKGAKLDETNSNEFMLVVEPKKITSKTLHFQALDQEDYTKWIDFLWRAILINKPDMVELKIEPMNSTKVLTFFIMKQQEEQTYQKNRIKVAQGVSGISGISSIMNQQVDMDDQFGRSDFQKLVIRTYQLSITNCIGVSLVDSSPKEIIQVSVRNIQMQYTTSDEQVKDESNQLLQEQDDQDAEEQKVGTTQLSTQYVSMVDKSFIRLKKEYLNVTVDLIIINNQLYETQFPVLLAPNKKKIQGLQQPFLMVSLFWKDQNKESTTMRKSVPAPHQTQQTAKISYIHTFTVFTDTLEIRLDDYILDAILNFSSQVQLIIGDADNYRPFDSIKTSLFDLRSLQAKLEESLKRLKKQNISQKYIKNLALEPIDICFTFRSSPGHQMNSTTKNYITDLGMTMASIDSAKIKLNSLKIQHIFGSTNEIISRITRHYSRQFLSQLYKLFGSFELFGNPVSLIENLGTGVIDMFYEPLYALVKGQSGYKVGEKFVSGAVSLIGHSIGGVLQTVNKILGTIMKILANITFDKLYIQRRQNKLNRTIKNFKEGLIIGFLNFGTILLSTLTCIIERPFNGLRYGGLLGLLLGIYQGVMGILIKPTVGIYDLLTTIIEGVKNTAVYEEHIMDTRYRPPRIFGENNLLIPFDFIQAIGTDILRKFKMKTIDSETILFFDQIRLSPEKTTRSDVAEIVLTDIRIVYVLNHSSVHYERIMVYKLQSIKYSEAGRKIIFHFHTPINRNLCGKSNEIHLPYESAIRASRLLSIMEAAFKDKYQIQFEYPHNPKRRKHSIKLT